MPTPAMTKEPRFYTCSPLPLFRAVRLFFTTEPSVVPFSPFRFAFVLLPSPLLLYCMIRLRRLLGGGGGPLGLVAAELGLRGLLDGALGALDGRDALDGVLAEIGTVTRLGGAAGNGLVGPVKGYLSQPPTSSLPLFL